MASAGSGRWTRSNEGDTGPARRPSGQSARELGAGWRPERGERRASGDGGSGRAAREGASGRPPRVPDEITADQLDKQARAELRTLPGDLAEAVARLLVAVTLADDPELAYRYAVQARELAARVGIVRETCGIAAYQAGHWAEALAELRAARRITGQSTYLPMMADCERALGRPDRALDLIGEASALGPEAISRATQIELRIVESGIRRDQGFPDAALVALRSPELTDDRIRPELARLYYAYADTLLETERADEARYWFGRAAAADTDGETDAAERLDEIDLISFEDLDEEELDEEELADADFEPPHTAPPGDADADADEDN